MSISRPVEGPILGHFGLDFPSLNLNRGLASTSSMASRAKPPLSPKHSSMFVAKPQEKECDKVEPCADKLQQNFEKANSVCSSIEGMMRGLSELSEMNAFWKNKYIACKKDHFAKFMGNNTEATRAAAFAEWKSWTFEKGTLRKVEGKMHDIAQLREDATALMENREAALSKKMQEMERLHQEDMAFLQGALAETEADMKLQVAQLEDTQAKMKVSDKLLKVVQSAIASVDDEDYKVDCKGCDFNAEADFLLGNFDYTKQSMHDILNEVDPKYVPPVGSLCVGPPPAPVGTPLVRASWT